MKQLKKTLNNCFMNYLKLWGIPFLAILIFSCSKEEVLTTEEPGFPTNTVRSNLDPLCNEVMSVTLDQVTYDIDDLYSPTKTFLDTGLAIYGMQVFCNCDCGTYSAVDSLLPAFSYLFSGYDLDLVDANCNAALSGTLQVCTNSDSQMLDSIQDYINIALDSGLITQAEFDLIDDYLEDIDANFDSTFTYYSYLED